MPQVFRCSALPAAMLCLGLSACGGNSATLGGSLSGLGSGLSVTVENNGGSALTLTANGGWAFPQTPADGSYDVTVVTQPTGQVCSVSNGIGTFTAATGSVASIVISCGTDLSLSGVVSGLASGTSVTLTDGSNLLTVSANGAFSFPQTLVAGTTYQVTVSTQPSGETCVVSNGSGTVASGVAIDITVSCS